MTPAGGAVVGDDGLARCPWGLSTPDYVVYHDTEWGRPVHGDVAIFERITLEAFQSGLAWITILRKREAFRQGFAGFDPVAVARFGPGDVERLMANAGIIRSRAKIEATIGNARAYLAMQQSGEDFADFCWSRVGGTPLRGDGVTIAAKTPLSEAMSKALKQRGFKFVGPVIVQAWMQGVGLVDDHARGCFRRTNEAPG